MAKVEERVAVARAAVGWAAVARGAETMEVEERAGTGTVAERAAHEAFWKEFRDPSSRVDHSQVEAT